MKDTRASLLCGVVLALLVVATACSGEATPTATQEVVGGVQIQAKGNLLFLTADTFEESLAQRIAQIDGVSQVDSYVEVATEPNAIMGVSPGSPLRVGGERVSLASGDAFPRDAENVAIPGIRVNANPYGFGMTGPSMAHRFQVGQSFELQGQRLRVIALYRAERDELENYILLPLSMVQRLYDMEGVITTVVVTVDPPQELEKVRREIQELLAGGQ